MDEARAEARRLRDNLRIEAEQHAENLKAEAAAAEFELADIMKKRDGAEAELQRLDAEIATSIKMQNSLQSDIRALQGSVRSVLGDFGLIGPNHTLFEDETENQNPPTIVDRSGWVFRGFEEDDPADDAAAVVLGRHAELDAGDDQRPGLTLHVPAPPSPLGMRLADFDKTSPTVHPRSPSAPGRQ